TLEGTVRHRRSGTLSSAGPQRLAASTEMRGTTRQTDARDRRAAARARLPGTLIDPKLLLIATLASGATHIIPDAGATLGDGPVQDPNERPTQTCGLRSRRSVRPLGRVQPRLKEGFIRINVADAGHHALVEQDRFQTPLRRRQTLPPVL